ncbi:hypothetical protein [Oligella sp. HMSC09E12]|uniref:hypothetical protein n=1 Tax=Oligella sp. HMSC09E12 TaxID=1581147 RepID=UPI0008A1C8C8|nr:hypothetical protein [Oligella sp. HMSC09E12]OFV50330.1 hypothetical protein HMPREF3179_02905 [Oligella sp. HMSC09E12]
MELLAKRLNEGRLAVSSNGKAAVAVGCWEIDGEIYLDRYAPRWIGEWKHREEFEELFEKAANKLGYKRDRRCKQGWRKVKTRKKQ